MLRRECVVVPFQGLLSDPDKSCPKFADHNLLVTGFGTNAAGYKYWKAKNSWGSQWGDNGYAYIPRTLNYGRGFCEMLSVPPLYPVVDPTYICGEEGGT